MMMMLMAEVQTVALTHAQVRTYKQTDTNPVTHSDIQRDRETDTHTYILRQTRTY